MCQSVDKNSPAIIGAGMMGTAIAAAHLRCGIPVLLYDNFPNTLETAAERVEKELQLQNTAFDSALLTICSDIDGISRRIVIETITEKLNAKKKLYRNLTENKHFSEDVFLFTNTSTITIARLAEALPPVWQRNFCGFHFFHPVRANSAVEIIAGKSTSSAAVDAARQHALSIDKQPIVVGDGPGFLVNRILNPYLSNALVLHESGVDMQRIENAALEFGMRMGPFRIMDEIGLDVVLHAGWVLHKAFPERVAQSPLLLELVNCKHLGRKTGRGFMLYPNKNPWDGDGIPNPEMSVSNRSLRTDISDDEIVECLIGSMYEEVKRCVEDGIIADLSVADFALVNALGFPRSPMQFSRYSDAQNQLR
ncbi:MAG: 3-hydroxyacyl-CoA dehydrogenase family protein [Planctomycetaceae bacterium]|nr:3-hydroxyacyl-CoA dehydrogenase family protein [Planctomycetaceae bacterium]